MSGFCFSDYSGFSEHVVAALKERDELIYRQWLIINELERKLSIYCPLEEFYAGFTVNLHQEFGQNVKKNSGLKSTAVTSDQSQPTKEDTSDPRLPGIGATAAPASNDANDAADARKGRQKSRLDYERAACLLQQTFRSYKQRKNFARLRSEQEKAKRARLASDGKQHQQRRVYENAELETPEVEDDVARLASELSDDSSGCEASVAVAIDALVDETSTNFENLLEEFAASGLGGGGGQGEDDLGDSFNSDEDDDEESDLEEDLGEVKRRDDSSSNTSHSRSSTLRKKKKASSVSKNGGVDPVVDSPVQDSLGGSVSAGGTLRRDQPVVSRVLLPLSSLSSSSSVLFSPSPLSASSPSVFAAASTTSTTSLPSPGFSSSPSFMTCPCPECLVAYQRHPIFSQTLQRRQQPQQQPRSPLAAATPALTNKLTAAGGQTWKSKDRTFTSFKPSPAGQQQLPQQQHLPNHHHPELQHYLATRHSSIDSAYVGLPGCCKGGASGAGVRVLDHQCPHHYPETRKDQGSWRSTPDRVSAEGASSCFSYDSVRQSSLTLSSSSSSSSSLASNQPQQQHQQQQQPQSFSHFQFPPPLPQSSLINYQEAMYAHQQHYHHHYQQHIHQHHIPQSSSSSSSSPHGIPQHQSHPQKQFHSHPPHQQFKAPPRGDFYPGHSPHHPPGQFGASEEGHRVVGPAKPVSDRSRKRVYRIGLNIFNKKPNRGIEYLIENKFIDPQPNAVAKFLISRKGLSRKMIGHYLGSLQDRFNMEVLKCFSEELDLTGLQIDVALRVFQSQFQISGEAQRIEKFMEVFSSRYRECNPHLIGKLFRSQDTVFLLSFAIIMLNTDLHNANIRPDRKMSLTDFMKNLKGLDDGGDISADYLTSVYERVKDQEFVPSPDHTNQVVVLDKMILGKKESLVDTHRRFVCHCRMHEVVDLSRNERIGSHNRGLFLFNDLLIVTKLSSKKKKNTSHHLKYTIPLLDVAVYLVETPHYKHGIRLKSSNEKILITLCASSHEEKMKFIEDLRESILETEKMEEYLSQVKVRASTVTTTQHQNNHNHHHNHHKEVTETVNRYSKDSGVVDIDVTSQTASQQCRCSAGQSHTCLSHSLSEIGENDRRSSRTSVDSGMSSTGSASANKDASNNKLNRSLSQKVDQKN